MSILSAIIDSKLSEYNNNTEQTLSSEAWFNQQIMAFYEQHIIPLAKNPVIYSITQQIIYSEAIDYVKQADYCLSIEHIPDLLAVTNYMFLMSDLDSIEETSSLFCAAYMLKHGIPENNDKLLRYAIQRICHREDVTPMDILSENALPEISRVLLLHTLQEQTVDNFVKALR